MVQFFKVASNGIPITSLRELFHCSVVYWEEIRNTQKRLNAPAFLLEQELTACVTRDTASLNECLKTPTFTRLEIPTCSENGKGDIPIFGNFTAAYRSLKCVLMQEPRRGTLKFIKFDHSWKAESGVLYFFGTRLDTSCVLCYSSKAIFFCTRKPLHLSGEQPYLGFAEVCLCLTVVEEPCWCT